MKKQDSNGSGASPQPSLGVEISIRFFLLPLKIFPQTICLIYKPDLFRGERLI